MRRTARRTMIALAAVCGVVAAGLMSPPSAEATGGSWSEERIGGMNVRIYTPASAPAQGDGRALMIALHGCVQTGKDMQEDGNWVASAEAKGMIVAVPDVPNGGVLLGCWDYYNEGHSSERPARHDDNLLELSRVMTARPEFGIDPKQVYISGASSGAGEAMVMGCLFPEVFAGVGLSAGPSVGTHSWQTRYVATTKARAEAVCRTFAGGGAAGFDTQIASIIYSDNDRTAAPGYSILNSEVYSSMYAAPNRSSFSLSELKGNNKNGEGTLFSDSGGPRVSLIQNTGVGHNWQAGDGDGGLFITANSIDYPAYITQFLFDNNRRVRR